MCPQLFHTCVALCMLSQSTDMHKIHLTALGFEDHWNVRCNLRVVGSTSRFSLSTGSPEVWMHNMLSNTSLDFFTVWLSVSFLNILQYSAKPGRYLAWQWIQSCPERNKLLAIHCKWVGKYELASYNGTLMELYGSQHSGEERKLWLVVREIVTYKSQLVPVKTYWTAFFTPWTMHLFIWYHQSIIFLSAICNWLLLHQLCLLKNHSRLLSMSGKTQSKEYKLDDYMPCTRSFLSAKESEASLTLWFAKKKKIFKVVITNKI